MKRDCKLGFRKGKYEEENEEIIKLSFIKEK